MKSKNYFSPKKGEKLAHEKVGPTITFKELSGAGFALYWQRS
jgi:hypothetical protein